MSGYLYQGKPGLEELNAAILAERADPRGNNYGHTREAPCGTTAAARRHRRHGEELCGPCLQAETRRRQDYAERKRKARQKARQEEKP